MPGCLPPSMRCLRSLPIALGLLLAFAPASRAGAPFVTDDADTTDTGHYEIDLGLQYTHLRGDNTGAFPSTEVDYGVTDNLELHTLVSLGFDQASGAPLHVGPGDSEIGIKYRFFDADDWGWRPGLAFAPTLIAPTGNPKLALGTGRTHAFLPLWLSKDFNQWTVFGGGGYTINPGPGNVDWWFAGVGVIYEINPQWTVGAEAYRTTKATTDGAPGTAFNLGVIYTYSAVHHPMMTIGRNLDNAAQNNLLSIYIGDQILF